MSIHEISGRPSPFLVRWRENGRNRSRSFSTRADAERFQKQLDDAVAGRERHAAQLVEDAAATAYQLVTCEFRSVTDEAYVVWTGEGGTSSAVHVDFIVGGGRPFGRSVPCLRVSYEEARALGKALIAVADKAPAAELNQAFGDAEDPEGDDDES